MFKAWMFFLFNCSDFFLPVGLSDDAVTFTLTEGNFLTSVNVSTCWQWEWLDVDSVMFWAAEVEQLTVDIVV